MAGWALTFKRHAVALDCYTRILAKWPDDTATLIRVACLHADTGDHATAIPGFRQALALRPENADVWFNLAYLHQQQQDHTAAIGAFGRALAINDRHDLSFYGLALSLIATARFDEAIAPLKRNIELQPMSPHGFMALARLYFRLGDRGQCEKLMRQLKAFDPQSAAALEDETSIGIGIERWWKH